MFLSVYTTRWRAIAAGLFLALLASVARAEESAGSAELILTDVGGTPSTALLLDTRIEGRVDGLVATLVMKQRFRNPADAWVNGEYLFPRPVGAAVDGLTLETDGKRITGVVKEKREAKREFDAAKASGKKAGLVTQRRPNLFSMNLANIPPRGEVIAEVTWVETVGFQSGRFTLTLPTTLTPRFIPGTPIEIPGAVEEFAESATVNLETGSGWAHNTDKVPDASLITPPQSAPGELDDSHHFSVDLEIQPGLEIGEISSITHGLDVKEEGSKSLYQVGLAEGTEPMDRDLVIEWSPAASSLPEAAAFRQGSDHTLLMVMPPIRNVVQTLPRELIFIIDSSGSMAGVSMPQAQQGLKTALGYLTAADRFNVIDFDSDARALFREPMAANPKTVGKATRFVDGLDADGGTNMEAALKLAFGQKSAEGFLRQIVFITDGSVGNEAALFAMINKRLGDARLFTLGIGTAPNAYFMRGAARFGRGSYHTIRDLSQAARNMAELFARINRPVMRDIAVTWPDGVAMEMEMVPERVSDLYLGEPLMVVARSDSPPESVVVSGDLAGQRWERTVNLTGAPEAVNLDKLWARGKVEQIESRQIMSGEPMENARDEIVDLGVAHQLATRYTSFVAVEEKISRPGDQTAQERVVPNRMPKGNQMAVPMPNTATSATLLAVAGTLLVMLAGLLQLFAGRNSVNRSGVMR